MSIRFRGVPLRPLGALQALTRVRPFDSHSALPSQNLAPVGKGGGEMVTGTLADMIEAQYHSMGELTEKMSAASVGVQGSGWGWLGYDKVNKRLAIATCANQVCVCCMSWTRLP